MKPILLLTILGALLTPTLGFKKKGALERIYYYDAYLADGFAGGTEVAPGCVGTEDGSRCNFEQFLAYIWKASKKDQLPPVAPQTPEDTRAWKLTYIDGREESDSLQRIALPVLVKGIMEWVSPVLLAQHAKEVADHPAKKAENSAAWAEYRKQEKAGVENPTRPKALPGLGPKPTPSETLTKGVGYDGALLPGQVPSGPAGYFETVKQIVNPLVPLLKSSEPPHVLVVNHAIETLDALFDLRLQDFDQDAYRPTTIANFIAQELSTLIHPVTGQVEEFTYATIFPLFTKFQSRDTAGMTPGLGGIDFGQTVTNIVAATGFPRHTIDKYLRQGVDFWKNSPHGKGHLKALESAAFALKRLRPNTPLPQYMP